MSTITDAQVEAAQTSLGHEGVYVGAPTVRRALEAAYLATTDPILAMDAVPRGYEIRPITCGGCSAPSTEFCRRAGGKDCYREFHGEGTRAPWAAEGGVDGK